MARCLCCFVFLFGVLSIAAAHAETGYDAWLRYRPLPDAKIRAAYRPNATTVTLEGDTLVLRAARDELLRGLAGLLTAKVSTSETVTRDGAIVLTTGGGGPVGRRFEARLKRLRAEGFVIAPARVNGHRCLVIAGGGERGTLYGAFAFLRRVQQGLPVPTQTIEDAPRVPLRVVNHWDNLAGDIERGYGGRSIFQWSDLPRLSPRYTDYARLLASVGIHGLCVNNVNADARILTPAYIEKVAALAGAFRPYGVRLYVAVNFDSPRLVGGLATSDPLDPGARAWWRKTADAFYRAVPDFGGFVVKADSEGRPGPYVYGRDHVDGANMLAEAVKPHGGLIFWRAFVYDSSAGQDRARMAYDAFKPLDGRFAGNVVVQIKHGPIDFQVREPVHPLFGALPNTNTAMELQIAQEYTGHNIHLFYWLPRWRDALRFDTHARGPGSTVRRIVDGTLYGQKNTGLVGVSNVGSDPTWLGHDLAMANLYGFGRLAWDPGLTADAIAREWTRLTFSPDPVVVSTVARMLMASPAIYERYTTPLGLVVLHEGGPHYDPAPEIRRAFHHADAKGIGWDRTVATGSGYAGLYHPPVSGQYENPRATPDDLLLFFHHVPYTHRLRGGKTVIQYLYDSHIEGVEQVRELREIWDGLAPRVDAERHARVRERLAQQEAHAGVWRDSIIAYFRKLSGIPDEKGRAPATDTPAR